ncbi:hypothetical protein [Spirochaeta cellobiosiphila]|uniref:hypothetical protein n=1 Tax=Spirochaeta cellobiosiphila TaxID=504483 RepID=UPI0003FC301F|nr:hypothetical protein [Spirochaeta cellobiosiphila]
MKIREEFKFILPRGIGLEPEIGSKVSGTMRLIKVKDLIQIQQDNRVKEDSSYFYVVLLSRILVKLGKEKMITSRTIEKLCPEDFAFLIDYMNQINHQIIKQVNLTCSSCGQAYTGEFQLLGEV